MIVRDKELADKIWLYKSFGHRGDEYFTLGVNGKNSEFHAAMGLCNLPRVASFIAARRELAKLYMQELADMPLQYPTMPEGLEYNYAYFPIVLPSEEVMHRVKDALVSNDINTRRYFYPSLNKLPYHSGAICPVSEDIASRVLSLPFYQDIDRLDVKYICEIIKNVVV
nr:DegT/DnrJ/EryC1/StrS family aminotransferase [Hymenobacter sp. 5414T-23]